MIDLARLLDAVPAESADAVIGMARLASRSLNAHLRADLGGSAGLEGSVLSEPYLEGAFPWLPNEGGWDGLKAGLLHPETLAVLRRVARPPYRHQVAAWSHLCAEDPRSVIVSSGTGSGKTECFLAPVLDRLIKVSDGGARTLEGVRAIMLYPLNALINSQEERLSAWFAPFEGRLRYALYNGETPEDEPKDKSRRRPWKVDNRTDLRNSPPPVLVTNITMLEYMLIRQKDAPILKKSKDTLDFVVLDEAHSYVGAQAAEIALLLRRVALAFGRRPDQLRYVATSATIGDGSERPLREFLRALSGAPDEQVFVVGGERAPLPPQSSPRAATLSLDALARADGQADRDLAASASLRRVRETLRDEKVLSWAGWRAATDEILGRAAGDPEAVELLVRAAAARDPEAPPPLVEAGGDSVLPVRVHLFHGTLGGLWACVDPTCPDRPDKGEEADWPFGAVYREPRTRCAACESLVLEWAFCARCGDGALKGEEFDASTRLGPWSEIGGDEDFEQKLKSDDSFGQEGEEGDVAEAPEAPRHDAKRRYLLPAGLGQGARIRIDRKTGVYVEDGGEGLDLSAVDVLASCPCCGHAPKGVDKARGMLRALSAGAPFLMSQIAPGLLSHLSPRTDIEPGAPMDGRQLITFTDARQGTARHAANIQIASERNFVRAFLYHAMQDMPSVAPAELEKHEKEVRVLKRVAEGDPSDREVAEMLALAEQRLAALAGGPPARNWSDVVQRLAGEATVKDHLRAVWRERDKRFDRPEALAEFLLYREIMRRPVRYTNAETLGLVRFVVPGWDGSDAAPPASAVRLGLTPGEWRDLLRLLLTHFVRTNVALQFDHRGWMPWIDRRQREVEVTRRMPDSVSERYVRFWPGATPVKPTRVVRMLAQALNLSLDDATARDQVNELMNDAWKAFFTFTVRTQKGVRFQLDRFQLAPVHEAFACPTTRRIVDTCLRGLSPYDDGGIHPQATPIRMPRLPYPFLLDQGGDAVDRAAVSRWLAEDSAVADLRARGLWGDQQDRAARFTPWLRAAEHSAQQPGHLLRRYEREFKAGQINVMSCSTTMEMGVDIGSIEAVLNTNTPPAIANYKQRIGRAGRQRQAISVGITLCKDRPLDRAAFADPGRYLASPVRAPKVSLDSPVIARRQANAFLLARFLGAQGDELHKLTNGHFFGLGRAPDAARPKPVEDFLNWIDAAPSDKSLLDDLAELLRGTPLLSRGEAAPDLDLWAGAREQMELVAQELEAEWEALQAQAPAAAPSGADRAVAKKARDFQRERLEKGYLLSELAGRGFLPSYGFPTEVVQFATETRNERETRREAQDEDRLSSRGYPSRSRDVAIFEYAPGRGIVVDGVVRESAGVTLNWKRPANQEGVREVQNLRLVSACGRCGALWSAPSAATRTPCPECGWNEPDTIRYLAPGGFAVAEDFQVHDDQSDLGALPPVDPWVSARGGAWRALPDPTVGRLRVSPTGLVFWFNPGPHGFGYGLCLHCGRAEAETTDQGGDILTEHEPLRGWPREKGGVCSGTPEINPFAVQRRLKLGHEIQTDVAELQLFDCASREAALAVALALREAVARRLGVDADEMGFAAPPARLPFASGQSWSAVIFDRASGGAGFSSTLADDPVGLLSEARALLDCRPKGRCGDPDAGPVCPLCVLAADSQHAAEGTDRRAAFALLVDVERRLALPEAHRLFGEATEYESAPLAEALSARLQADPDAQLTAMLPDGVEGWDFEAWPMTGVLDRWGVRGRSVAVAFDGAALAETDPVTRRRVALWAQRARLRLLDRGRSPPEPPLLATVSRGGETMGWASLDPEAGSIGPAWAAVSSAPIVRGRTSPLAIQGEVSLESLLEPRLREAVFDIGGELDGPVEDFGRRFRELIRGLGPDLATTLARPAVELVYEDRYLFSPLSVRLVAELLGALSDDATRVTIRTLASRNRDTRLGRRVEHDWRTLADRDHVLGALLGRVAPRTTVEALAQVGHRRVLRFRTPSGSGVVYFDQGVGAWRAVGEVPFDFTLEPGAQGAALAKSFGVINPFGTYAAVKLDPTSTPAPA